MAFKYIDKQIECGELIANLQTAVEIGLDVETNSLDPVKAKWLLLQLEINDSIYIIDIQKVEKTLVNYIIQLLEDSNKKVIGHNIKYDLKVIYVNTEIMLTNCYDTMIAEVLINQGIGKQYYALDYLVKRYLNITLDKEVRKSFEDSNGNFTNEQLIYSALDVKYLKDIKELQKMVLNDQRQSSTLTLEMSIIPAVVSMELNGVKVDIEKWKNLISENEKKLASSEKDVIDYVVDNFKFKEFPNLLSAVDFLKIPAKTKKLRTELEEISDASLGKDWIKRNFNVASNPQMLIALRYDGVNVESTGEKIITPYKEQSELVRKLLLFREYKKKVSTYGNNILDELNPETNRLHVEFNQVGTFSGRFSVSRLHQIPRGKEYRNCFIGNKDYKIITADYSQQEFRLLGAFTQDPKIIEAYVSGHDIHTATASIKYKAPLSEIIPDQRYIGKTINFALGYGATPWGLAYNLKISLTEAEELFLELHKGYKVMFEVKEYTENKILEKMYSTTPIGRKRFFKEKSFFTDYKEKEKYERQIKKEGWNHIIQGWGADITKLAMDKIYRENPFGDKLNLYLQLHDELDIEAYKDIAEESGKFVHDCMVSVEQPFLGEIPAVVEYEIADYWTK